MVNVERRTLPNHYRLPFVIGLTGTIAAGKSTVANMLADLGGEVIDADKVAHQTMSPGQPAYQPIVDEFGRSILASDGTIDRPKLGAIVFQDPARLARLDELVHPYVNDELDRLVATSGSRVLTIEAIKLIEAGGHNRCDSAWVVTANRDQQLTRLTMSRGMSEPDASRRLDAQGPVDAKVRYADVVIDNSGEFDETRRQVETEFARLVDRRIKQG